MTTPIIPIDLEALVSSRALIQGSSGAGKSFLLRYLLEQTHGKIQQFVFDPEGEFSTLREHFDYVVASAGGDGDVPAHPDTADLLCRQLVELEASAILDIYELDPEDREAFVGNFLSRLVRMPKNQWRPALVVVDEAHEYAPQAGDPASRRPMEMIVSKGRKRGLCAIYATQRLSKLSKNASDLQNILVGYTGLDVDVKRAADILGLDRTGSQQLKRLEHEFLAFGPAFSREVTRVRSGPIQSHHPKPGEIRPPTPPPRGELAKLVQELAHIPERAAEEERTIEGLQERVRHLQAELRQAMAERPDQDEVPPGMISIELAEERIRAAEQRVLDELQELAERRAAAAVAELRTTVRPHVEALHHALANGHAEIPAQDLHTPAAPAPIRRPAQAPAPPRGGPARRPAIAAAISPRHQKILDALARLEAMGIRQPSRSVLAAVAGTSPKSSGYEKSHSRLSALGFVAYPGPGDVALTDEGRNLSAQPSRAVTLQELHASWFRILEPRHQRILEPLIRCYPKALSREDLAERSKYSSASSGYEKAISRLSSFGIVTYPEPGHVAATELLMPRGLR